jgi:hypothetical protein
MNALNWHLKTSRASAGARPLGLLALCVSLALAVGDASAATPPAPMHPPSVSTSGLSSVSFSSAVLTGYVIAEGQDTTYHFQYGPTTAYGVTTPIGPAGNGTTSVKVSQYITGLQPGTTYHYRVVAINATGTTNGNDRAFTTPRVPLSLQIVGVPNPVLFGEPFTVEGSLSGTGSANHAIVLQANPFPYTAGFKTLGNPELTTTTGGFSFPVVGLLENTQLRVQTLGAPTVTSSVLLESVAIKVSFHVRRVHRRGFVRLYGSVTPAEAGAQVGFQRLVVGGRTVNDGGTLVKDSTSTTPGGPSVSSFSRTIRLRHRGVYRALVKISDGAHVSAYSAPILVR